MKEGSEMITLSLQKTQFLPWRKPNYLLETIIQLGRFICFAFNSLAQTWFLWNPILFPIVWDDNFLSSPLPPSGDDLDVLHCQKPWDTRSLIFPPPNLTPLLHLHVLNKPFLLLYWNKYLLYKANHPVNIYAMLPRFYFLIKLSKLYVEFTYSYICIC